jgi:hypothetical protein
VLRAPVVMASLVEKVGSLLPLEPGERILCAAYVPASGTSIGSSVVAVSDRRLLFAPRSAFLSVGAWASRQLDEIRVESVRPRLGFGPARRFEIVEAGEPPFVFEVEKKEAREFHRALEGRLVART